MSFAFNAARKVILVLYAVGMLLACLFVPWMGKAVILAQGTEWPEYTLGFAPVWSPPDDAQVDLSTMGFEIVSMTILAGLAFLLAGVKVAEPGRPVSRTPDRSGMEVEQSLRSSFWGQWTLLSLKRQNAWVPRAQGMALRPESKRKEAEVGYQRALALDPKLVNARINLGAMYLEDPPQPDKAIAALEPAVALEPDAADLHLNLAYAYRLGRQPEKAAAHYRTVLKADDNPDVRFMLVEVLGDAGKSDEMVAELNKLLPLYDKDVKRIAFIGMRFAKAHAFTECVDTFNKAIKLNAKDPNLWLNRGLCRHELKQDEESVADDYRKALEIDKTFQPAWYYLGVSYAAQKKRAKAVDSFERCTKLGPDTPVGKRAKEKWDALIKEVTKH